MRSGAWQMWSPPTRVEEGCVPAKRAAAGDEGGRLHLQLVAGAAGGGGVAGHAVHHSSGPLPARQPAAPPGAWQQQPRSWPAAGGSRWAPQHPSGARHAEFLRHPPLQPQAWGAARPEAAKEGLLRRLPHTPPPGLERIHHSPSCLDSPTSWQSEESCACEGWSAAPPGLHHSPSSLDSPASFQQHEVSRAREAAICRESGGWAPHQASSAAPPGLRLDRPRPGLGAALVDFSAGDPCQRRALGGFPPRMPGSHAFPPQATGALAPADVAISVVDPDCNVSFFPDVESCCALSCDGRAFRVGIAPQEAHLAAGAVAAPPRPTAATARASAQGGAPAGDLAPTSAAAPLDPDAVGDRPPTTMEFEDEVDAQRPFDRAATTMVVRNVPLGATKQELLDELNRSGFAGAYDFAYLPRDFKSHVGKGHAFVNFVEPEAAAAFAAAWHRTYRFGLTSGDGIPLNVAAASVQGLQANVDKWTSYRRGRVKNSNYLPFVMHE